MKKKYKKIGFALIFILIVALAALAVMLLWNALIPSIIGWYAIGYWQALGLIVLCKILFGGMRSPMGGWGHHFHKHHKHHKEHAKLHGAMKGMSREERRDFIRERMAQGFGGFEGFGDFHDKHDKPDTDHKHEGHERG